MIKFKSILEYPSDHKRITEKVNHRYRTTIMEKSIWQCFSQWRVTFTYNKTDFLDKELVRVADLDKSQKINQKWSWDRILRSPYIKQADVLQCFYFFEDHFSKEELKIILNFMNLYSSWKFLIAMRTLIKQHC
jgi:maltose phosphorylase